MITRGLFLGKFMPPHDGHLLVARSAARLVDELTVLVCSLDGDPIDGATRFGWMREMLPQSKVIHYDKPIPQTPGEHPQFWDIWREAIHSCHPAPLTHLFGSDAYIHRLGEVLGAAPVLIDPGREAIPVSSSDIRRDPFAHWRFIPDAVKPHYVRRVCVFGPESTGKTTLALYLADRFDTVCMPEYGRIFDEQYRPGKWTTDHLVEIGKTHEAMRQALSRNANRILIEDTDAVLTAVWSEALTGTIDPWFDREFDLPDLYLLTDVDVPWVDDGLRLFGSDRQRRRFFDRARAELDNRGAVYEVLSGSFDERNETARRHVERLLQRDPGLA